MTNDETHMNGFSGQVAFSISTAKDFSYIKFETGPGFKKSLTNPLKIADGRTVGQAEKDSLHEKLDQWIDENLKETK